MEQTSFTIAICTLNRLPYLRRAVDEVLRQLERFPRGRLLVVDNGSTDDTLERLRALARARSDLEVVGEPRRGLYHARARAIDEATGEFLIFLDDDAVPEPGWLDAILRELTANPQVGVVGAAIDPLWESDPPNWLSDRLLRNVPVYDLETERHEGRFPAYPSGICLGLRINACLCLYAAPERRRDYPLGRRETSARGGAVSLIGCEDTDLCEIYSRNGFRVIFVKGVRVKHTVARERLVPDWFIRKFRSDGHARIRILRLTRHCVVGRHSLPMLLCLPAFAGLALVARLLPQRQRVLVRAYRAKCLGAWVELLRGPRFQPFPYLLDVKEAGS